MSTETTKMQTYHPGDMATAIAYWPIKGRHAAAARLRRCGIKTRSGWRAVGITQRGGVLTVGPNGYWFEA